MDFRKISLQSQLWAIAHQPPIFEKAGQKYSNELLRDFSNLTHVKNLACYRWGFAATYFYGD